MCESPHVPDAAGQSRAQSVATEPPRTPSPPPDAATPPARDGYKRTPIRNKASSTILPTLPHSLTEQAHKDHTYDPKIAAETDEATAEVSHDTFMTIAFGDSEPALTEEEMEAIGGFDELVGEAVTHEKHMYPIVCSKLNTVLRLAGDSYIAKDVAELYESCEVDHRPDIGIYPLHDRAQKAFTPANLKTAIDESRRPYRARVAWAWLECVGELKYDPKLSGYLFKEGGNFPEGVLHQTKDGVDARAQITKYATEMMWRQHRTHVFTFYVLKSRARLMRWDRAGQLISEPIDLLENPRHFLDFFYRMAQAQPAQLGHDPTATLADDDQVKLFCEHRTSNVHAKDMLARAVSKVDAYPIYKIQCQTILLDNDGDVDRDSPDGVQMQIGEYLVGKPTTYCCSPTGRATRGYVALSIELGRLVFLKDAWRANCPEIHPELETYLKLNNEGVCNVPTALGGGDVGGATKQRTVTQEYISGPDAPLERLHSRLILQELGRPLDSYADSAELMLVVLCAFQGHREAWEKARILHRDVSTGNILIDIEGTFEQPRGLLADWDLCKYEAELSANPTQPGGRSGTWPFLSALALKYPKKPIELADDLESFAHVLTYTALRFHEHNLAKAYYPNADEATRAQLAKLNTEGNKNLAKFVQPFFYEETEEEGFVVGGTQKLASIAFGFPGFTLLKGRDDQEVPLARLLNDLYALLHQHYAALDTGRLEQYRVRTRASRQESQPKVLRTAKTDFSAYFRSRARLASSAANPSRNSEAAIPLVRWLESTPPKPVLNSHAAMEDAFVRVWTGPGGPEAVMADCAGDKTLDQLYGLVQIVERRPVNASGTSLSKRKASNDPSLPPAKHLKLGGSSLSAEQFGAVQEDDGEAQ